MTTTDERLRSATPGSVEHCTALVRTGERWRVELAAYCGHEAAREVVPAKQCPSCAGSGMFTWPSPDAGFDRCDNCRGAGWLYNNDQAPLPEWLRGLARWDTPERRLLERVEAAVDVLEYGWPGTMNMPWSFGQIAWATHVAETTKSETQVRAAVSEALITYALELEPASGH